MLSVEAKTKQTEEEDEEAELEKLRAEMAMG
jgi:charged multivesicular body protein 4